MSSVNAQLERIQDQDIDLTGLLAMSHFPECGGLALFAGTVRDHHAGNAVHSLKYTAYKPLAERLIREIEQQIEQKYGVPYVRVVHRIGHLAIGEVAIYAVARSAHRREAFAACEEAVERVKHEVPVWKQEFYPDGSSIFVEGCCIRRDHAVTTVQQSSLQQNQTQQNQLEQSQRQHSQSQHGHQQPISSQHSHCASTTHISAHQHCEHNS